MKGSGNDNEASLMAVCNPITSKKLVGILYLWFGDVKTLRMTRSSCVIFLGEEAAVASTVSYYILCIRTENEQQSGVRHLGMN